MKKLKSEPRIVRGFMCAVDWLYELGEAMDGTTIYPSTRCNGRMCLDECGVVEVEVRYVRTVRRGIGTPNGPTAKQTAAMRKESRSLVVKP